MSKDVFDPLAWANNNASNVNEPAKADAPVKNPQPTVADMGNELDKAKAVADELISRGANIAESYDDYLQLGFALANGLGEAGGDIYHRLCAQSSKYREGECEKKWQECLRKNDGRTTIASFYKMAQDAGIDLSAISRQFPSNPQNPQGKGNLGKYANSTVPKDSTTFPQGEGSEGIEGNSDFADNTNDNQSCGYSETFSDKIDNNDYPSILRTVADTQNVVWVLRSIALSTPLHLPTRVCSTHASDCWSPSRRTLNGKTSWSRPTISSAWLSTWLRTSQPVQPLRHLRNRHTARCGYRQTRRLRRAIRHCPTTLAAA